MKGYVYILKDKNNRFYVGSTIDFEKRLWQHKLGHTQTTKNMDEPKLVLVQEFKSLTMARKIEMKIKKMKRKDYIEKMVTNGRIQLKSN